MTTKTSPSMIRRYTGPTGHQLLTDAICIQPVVAGERAIAQQLVAKGRLLDLKPGRILIQQDNADNDVYFIVSGEVAININGRDITNRGAGRHVGEMALLDPTARRSATVIAKERTLVLQVAEPEISLIATQHPQLWRRFAVELGSRLRERSKFIPQPHATPVIFIGSSSEALREATWVSNSLNRRPIVSQLWTQGIFHLSKTTIEDLMRTATESDFAALLLTPDDMTASRGKKKVSPRDNAVFELGLFMGALGRDRAFIVTPKGVDLKLPTDLLGMTHLQYTIGNKKTLGKRMTPVSRALWNRIKQLGAR